MRMLVLVTLSCLLMAVGCGRRTTQSPASAEAPYSGVSRPTEREAEDFVRGNPLEGQESFKLLSIKTTISDAAGHKGLYFVNFDCEIEFTKDCYCHMTEGYFNDDWGTSPIPGPGMLAKKKGDRSRVKGRYCLKKTEKGWTGAG
jgi:hypothetical protein